MSNIALAPLSARNERQAGGHVKGSMLRAHLDWVRDHTSREETIEFYAALPDGVRRQVSTVLAASWYEFTTLIEIDRAILTLFGNGDPRFLERLGAFSAEVNLAGVYRFFRRDGVHDFFRRSALLHDQFQDFGTAEYAEESGTSGTMRHREYPSFSPLFCASAIGYYRECVQLHGGRTVEVAETECQCAGDEACTFEIRWT